MTPALLDFADELGLVGEVASHPRGVAVRVSQGDDPIVTVHLRPAFWFDPLEIEDAAADVAVSKLARVVAAAQERSSHRPRTS